MKKRILSVICVSLTAALTITACGSSTTSSSTTSSNSSQDSNSDLSNDELKELAMEGGISPYDFKEEVDSNLGKGCYSEDIFGEWEDINLNAELDQVGEFWDSKDEAVNHSAEGTSSGYEGVHLLTYDEEINTSESNPALEDFIEIMTGIFYTTITDAKVYTNEDLNFFYVLKAGNAGGTFNLAFRIIGNSMIYVAIGDGKEDPYAFLNSWDTTGEYGMNQINIGELTDATDAFNDSIQSGTDNEVGDESETKDANDTDVAKTEESTGGQLDANAMWPDTSGAKTSIDQPVRIKTAAATIEGPYVLEKGNSGDKYICYFVTNTSDMNISFSLSVDCYDKDDNHFDLLVSAISDQLVQCLGPDETAFVYKGFYYSEKIASVQPEISVYNSDYTSATEYMDIERVEDNGEENYFRFECKNTSSSTIYSPEITVVYYTDDEYLGFDSGSLLEIGTNNSDLDAGATAYAYMNFPDKSSFNIHGIPSGFFKD